MRSRREDLIRLLEAELDVLEWGGYGRSVREPWKPRPIFQHSVVCINHWVVPGHPPECHEGCVLLDFVPEEHRQEALPCHFIPLNEKGETIASLQEKGDQARLEEAVKQWLQTVIRLLKEAALEEAEKPEVPY